jgi:hypothetical protein
MLSVPDGKAVETNNPLRLTGLGQPVVAALAQALQGAAAKRVDVTPMRLDVMRNGRWLDLAVGQAQLAHPRSSPIDSGDVAHFLRFRNGKIVKLREFMDSLCIAEQALGREIRSTVLNRPAMIRDRPRRQLSNTRVTSQ